MLRVRLKADGRLVEILPDGSERAIPTDPRSIATAAHQAARSVDARSLVGGPRDRLRIAGNGLLAAVRQDFDQSTVRFQSHAQHGAVSGVVRLPVS